MAFLIAIGITYACGRRRAVDHHRAELPPACPQTLAMYVNPLHPTVGMVEEYEEPVPTHSIGELGECVQLDTDMYVDGNTDEDVASYAVFRSPNSAPESSTYKLFMSADLSA